MPFTLSKVILLIGIILMILGAFNVEFSAVHTFELGVAIGFSSFLVP